MTLQQLKEEAYRKTQKFWLTNEPLPDFIDSLVDKAYEEGKKEGRKEVIMDLEDLGTI